MAARTILSCGSRGKVLYTVILNMNIFKIFLKTSIPENKYFGALHLCADNYDVATNILVLRTFAPDKFVIATNIKWLCRKNRMDHYPYPITLIFSFDTESISAIKAGSRGKISSSLLLWILSTNIMNLIVLRFC